MTDFLPRVVLDTVVFVQALISGRGPAARCIEQFRAGRYILLQSDKTLAELRDVALRPRLTAKYAYVTPEKVDLFIAEMTSLSVNIHDPPAVFALPRDPKDEPFIDLAVTGGAQFIVTWNDRHLTYLMRRDTEEGKDFCGRFPSLRIVSPPEFLANL